MRGVQALTDQAVAIRTSGRLESLRNQECWNG